MTTVTTFNSSNTESTEINVTFASSTLQTIVVTEREPQRTMVYVFLPIGIVAFLAFLTLIVILVLRKSKLDRLRHHLMPMYSFDPAEENQDWESELLEDQEKNSNHSPASASSPMLKFLPRK